MLYKGNLLHQYHMKSIFQAMEDEVIKVWEDKVLMGLKIWLDYGNIVEDLTNKNVLLFPQQ
jgi:hypothetical protein